ncbi:TIGR02611 family protein [Nocardia farcinica]|nr:TIGR02611 family protein [Nocardia farcinica]MBF6417457.1 TIGR02611 family protein [Nocardia farcinica]MBF6429037.1 TIGR02611 family protein [Nocardia farcinica]MBF6504585.1 TIGR02611 family protein [Nocardia farcinica]
MSSELDQQTGSAPMGRLRAFRARVAARPTLNLAYRIGVGVVGAVVLAIGIIAIPYPGPGWAMVFAGLGILASEFAWAQRALRWLRDRYRQVMAWYSARGLGMRILGAVGTAAVVVATLWVLGTFGLVGGWFGLEWEWLRGPLQR